jgi:hypothetical protein
MKSLKKMGAALVAVAMLASSASAFACANDKFISFDDKDPDTGLYGKIYKCPLKGDYVYAPVSEKDTEWKHAFYEAEYPHRDVEQLWLEGAATGITRYTGKEAVVNTVERPDFWECKAPYFVYNKVYSDFTGKFEPTNVLKTNYKTAPVATGWEYKGFDQYVKEADGTVVDYSHVYGLYDNKIDFEWHQIKDLAEEYNRRVLADYDNFLKGKADYAYSVFENAIKRVSWLELEGPDYGNGGTTKVVPFANIVNGSNPTWYDDLLVSNNAVPTTNFDHAAFHLNVSYKNQTADIEWVTVGYELEEPYRYYQVLSIDGVLMDGREIEVKGYEVKKEEVVEVKSDFADEIHVIEKATELTGYSSSEEYSYILTPFTTEAKKTVFENEEYTVIDDYMRETVLAKYGMPAEDLAHEIRFVKVSTQPGKTRLPYIWRYAGGYANPKVEWKTAFAEAAKPYEIYEEKFVDDIPTGVYRTTGRYADDVATVSTELGQPRVLTVVLEDTVDKAKLVWALEDAGYGYILRDNKVTVIVPAELYAGHEDLDTFRQELDYIVNIKASTLVK